MELVRESAVAPVIAALFVETEGCYFGVDGVDPWDAARDARRYEGPHPVVAHPPCERWGRYATGGPNPRAARRARGDDGGCFAAAIAAVRRWGGVLEHPADSSAWDAFGLSKPIVSGGWQRELFGPIPAWTCHVEQGHYGHHARKATWLYAVGIDPPSLRWGPSRATGRLEESFPSSEARRAARAAGVRPVRRMSKRRNEATPIEFRDLLISIARSARR